MSGNTFGQQFKLTSFGESHGEMIGGIVDGCPPCLNLDEGDIQKELDRRKPGQSRHTTQRREADKVKIASGVFEGKTTGCPIGLLIENTDTRSKDYANIKDLFRPGHADFTYHQKYGHRDYRGGGRSSARETAIRVAAGAIAKKVLYQAEGIEIKGFVSQIGKLKLEFVGFDSVEHNPFFCPNSHQLSQLEALFDQTRKAGDSLGAQVRVVATNTPVGLGEPIFNRLDAQLAQAMMSINAVKAVGIGAGFKSVSQLGSEHRDEMGEGGFLSNHSGGILGGISTGQDIVVDVVFKPTSSIRQSAHTLDTQGKEHTIEVYGRHDPCVGLRGVVIAEAMMALVLLDDLLIQRGRESITHKLTHTP